ncbi:hypothetical protein KXV39_008400, partial [Aspergillus fumigatus]
GYASRSISLPDISHTDQRLCPNPNNIPDSGYASRSISLPDISHTDQRLCSAPHLLLSSPQSMILPLSYPSPWRDISPIE